MRRVARWLAAVLVLAAPPLAAQNLFVNPDLDASLLPWVLGCGTQMSWQTADEAGCPGSGSAHVTSGPCQSIQGAGMGQCVPVTWPGVISLNGRVRATTGWVIAVLQFFAAADCTGALGSAINSGLVPANQNWQTVSLDNRQVPPSAVAALVGIGAVAATAVNADIDAGYAGALPLVFREDFEGNLGGTPPACRWSAVAP